MSHLFICFLLFSLSSLLRLFLIFLLEFPRKILFLTGEKDYRGAETKFLAAAQPTDERKEKIGKLQIFPNVAHEVLIHQNTFDPSHKAILGFLKDEVYPDEATIHL